MRSHGSAGSRPDKLGVNGKTGRFDCTFRELPRFWLKIGGGTGKERRLGTPQRNTAAIRPSDMNKFLLPSSADKYYGIATMVRRLVLEEGGVHWEKYSVAVSPLGTH